MWSVYNEIVTFWEDTLHSIKLSKIQHTCIYILLKQETQISELSQTQLITEKYSIVEMLQNNDTFNISL